MTYPSKIDWWLGAILIAAGLTLGGAGLFTLAVPWVQPGVSASWALVGLIPLALGLLILWQLLATGYKITPEALVMKSGPFHWKVALDQISDVYATRNPPPGAPGYSLLDHFRGNHPALSLDRLQVNYRSKAGMRFYLISPRDKAGFLDELAQAVPGLQVL